MGMDANTVSILVQVAAPAVEEIIKLVQSHGGTATIQATLDADAATIAEDQKTLEGEKK